MAEAEDYDYVDGTIPGISNFTFRRKVWQPSGGGPVHYCNRCSRKIYPVEKVDVGPLYHRGCFKCVTCSRQLTLQSFQLGPSDRSSDGREVFCGAHVPKHAKGLLDKDALGIKAAMDAQRARAAKNQQAGMEKGWQYNPFGELGGKRQSHIDPTDTNVDFPMSQDSHVATEDVAGVSPERVDPPAPPPDLSMPSVDNFMKSLTPHYTLKRRSTITSVSDFERHGIYDAQDKLEKLHKEEEDALYRQIFSDRRRQMQQLEELLQMEKERTVNELIEWFNQYGFKEHDRKSMMEKVEMYYAQQREERRQVLLESLAAEESAAVARLIEKHSKEMLLLIARRERLAESAAAADPDITSADDDDEDAVFDTSGETGIVPPDNRKSELYTDPNVFNELDKHAIKEAQKEHATFTDLVRQLSVRCQNELQKIRAIFRWITVKDLNKMKFDTDLDPDSPLGLLRGIKFGTESYHDLFRRLCSYAGIYVEIIEGYSKGAGYRPGTKIQGSMFRNQWSAAYVDGYWRFINCNWGARRVRTPGATSLFYKCDEFYFLTDPEEHIFQHYPDQKKWQLLHEPYDFDDFLRLPLTKSPFFNSNLTYGKNYGAVLTTDDGFTEILIKCKKTVPITATIAPRTKEGTAKPVPDSTLVRYIDNHVIILTSVPYSGKYHLDIFIGENWFAETMELGCSFLILCQKSSDFGESFPPIPYAGLTPFASEIGLSLQTNKDPYIKTNCELNLTFDFPEDLRMTHNLQFWDLRERKYKLCDNFAVLKCKTSSTAMYYFRFPKVGLFTFTIFAANATARVDLQCAYKCVIDCLQAADRGTALPTATTRWNHCKLHEPIEGVLPTSSRIKFKISSTAALEIAVSSDGQWYSLEKDEVTWSGAVPTGPVPGKAIVYGRFEAKSSKLAPLLEYRVM